MTYKLPLIDQVAIPDRAQLLIWEHEGIDDWFAVISRYLPGISEGAAQVVLWDYCGYPFAGVDEIVEALEGLRREWKKR